MGVLALDRVRELLESGKTDSEIGAAMGVSKQSVFRYRQKYGLAAAVDNRGRPVIERDLTAPRVDGTTRIVPIKVGRPSLRVDLAAMRDDLADEVRQITKGWKVGKAPTPPKHASLLHLIAPVDLHVGKLAWKGETGEDYDSAIAAARLQGAVDRLIGLAAKFPVREQVLVVGNDLLQVDNLLSTTTAGTFQDTDSRYRKMFRLSVRLMADTVRRMMAVGPVRVLIVPGNHDVLASFHVGEVLAEIFRDVSGVTIDDSLRPRLYHRHGNVLLGFCHGNEERHSDLPLIMAQEQPEAWAQSKYREFLVGHLHKKKETHFTAGDSFNGVRVSILESLSGTDAWHARKGYIGEPKASQSRLYDAEVGPVAAFTATMAA